jgi:hypothetical protein
MSDFESDLLTVITTTQQLQVEVTEEEQMMQVEAIRHTGSPVLRQSDTDHPLHALHHPPEPV